MANQRVHRIDFTPQGVVLQAKDETGKLLSYTFPAVGGVAPPSAPPIGATPGFIDRFEADDASRWMGFDGQHWPPVDGSPGRWARCYYYGWPSHTGAEDPASRLLANNKEAQCYEDRAVTISPEGLVLTATRDKNNHHGMPWTSGAVVQNRDLSQLYGYFEVTARLPLDKGMWPAFWLLAKDLVWPPEIDVMESVGLTADNAPSSRVFRQGIVQGESAWPEAASDLNGWHKFGVLWTPETIQMTLDGKVTVRQPTPASYKKPMYVLLNLAVGGPGSWPGEPDPSLTKASMTVRQVVSYPLGSWGSSLLPITP